MDQGIHDVATVVLLDQDIRSRSADSFAPSPIQDDSRIHDLGHWRSGLSMTWATVVLLDHKVLTGLPPSKKKDFKGCPRRGSP